MGCKETKQTKLTIPNDLMYCDDNFLAFVLQILTGNKEGLVESIPLWTSSSSWTCQVISPEIIDKTKVLTTNGSLMKVESIAECSLGAFCNTFDLH